MTAESTNAVRAGLRAVLLDIEGTTTPIAFVHEVLFTYARQHVRDFLAQHADTSMDDIGLLRAEHSRDTESGAQPPPLTDDVQLVRLPAYLPGG